jgi:hypothetical protein
VLKTAAKFALLRVLPRRILPIVTVVEVLLFVRSIRKRSTVRVNDPVDSRTGRPPVSPAVVTPATGPTTRSDGTVTDPV